MRTRRLPSYGRAVEACLVAELIVLGLAVALAKPFEKSAAPIPGRHALFGFLVIVVYAALTGLMARFEAARTLERPLDVRAAGGRFIAACLIGVLLCAFNQGGRPDLLRISTLALGLGALLLAFRWLCGIGLARLVQRGLFDRRVVLFGGGETAAALVHRLSTSGPARIDILGMFDDRMAERRPAPIAGVPHRGTSQDLIAFVRSTRVDMVIITLSISADLRILELVDRLWVLPVDIRLAMEPSRLPFRRKAYSFIGGSALVDLCDRPIAGIGGWAKAVLDRLIGSLCLALALPVMALIAIAIKATSRGPVLFCQQRYGFNNEVIEIYKFRSMYVETLDQRGDRSVMRDDPRVTPLGRLLRKTSFDELPQLFNVVFKGNLSLVGPRPHVPTGKVGDVPYDAIVNHYCARHRVRPGMTGWAQINGWRGSTMTPDQIERRVEFDLAYIDKWSIWLDLYILSKTPFAVIGGKGAY